MTEFKVEIVYGYLYNRDDIALNLANILNAWCNQGWDLYQLDTKMAGDSKSGGLIVYTVLMVRYSDEK